LIDFTYKFNPLSIIDEFINEKIAQNYPSVN